MANRENVARLVETLRTTDVAQTKGYLNIVTSGCEHVKTGMCCLGVACSLVPGLRKDQETAHCVDCEAEYTFITYDGVYGMLPEAASMFYDLPSSPTIAHREHPDMTAMAIMANDSFGYSFEEIAQGFETKYLS